MRILSARVRSGSLATVAGGFWSLSHNAATQRFRLQLDCTAVTGGFAQRIQWQSSSLLRLGFPAITFDGLQTDSPEVVTAANNGSDGVLLTFQQPRLLQRVRILSAGTNDIVEVRRTDGQVITEDPFKTAQHFSNGAELNVIDKQLIVRLKPIAGTRSLRTNDLAGVMLRSDATNVRVGVLLPSLSNEVSYLAPDATPLAAEPHAPAQIGTHLAALLQNSFDRLADALVGATLPSAIPFSLVFESDSPAQLAISHFRLDYHLVREQFVDGAAKQVFSFPGGRLHRQAMGIEVPPMLQLHRAQLRLSGHFVESATAVVEDLSDDKNDPLSGVDETLVTNGLSIRLGLGETAASLLQPSQALVATAILLGLRPLTSRVTLLVRVRQPADDQPGDVLAEAPLEISLTNLGRQRVDLAAPIVLASAPYWLEVQVNDGLVLWQLQPDTQGHVLKGMPKDQASGTTARTNSLWQRLSSAQGFRGDAALLSAGPLLDEDAADAETEAFKGVRLKRGQRRIKGATQQSVTSFEVANALRPLLMQNAPEIYTVELHLESSEKNLVTWFPPRMEYDSAGFE